MELVTFYIITVVFAIGIGVARLMLTNANYKLSDIVGYAIFSIVPLVNILMSILMLLDWSSKIPNGRWDGKQKRIVAGDNKSTPKDE